MEAFPTPGLALQLEMPTVVATSILHRKVGEEFYNSDQDSRLEVVPSSIQLEVVPASIHLEVVVAATSEAARLWETLPTASRVLGPYENLVA
jgi:hypothetical protein